MSACPLAGYAPEISYRLDALTGRFSLNVNVEVEGSYVAAAMGKDWYCVVSDSAPERFPSSNQRQESLRKL
jgi:hypothetical protein